MSIRRHSRSFQFPSVVHGCMAFIRLIGRFWDFHFHRLPVGEVVVAIVEKALDYPWPPVGSPGVSVLNVTSNSPSNWEEEIWFSLEIVQMASRRREKARNERTIFLHNISMADKNYNNKSLKGKRIKSAQRNHWTRLWYRSVKQKKIIETMTLMYSTIPKVSLYGVDLNNWTSQN